MSAKLNVAREMIARYNAQDADGYVALMTADASEGVYGSDGHKQGQAAIRDHLTGMFAQYPQNRADILTAYALGDHVVLHEKVARSPEAAPFEVVSIYSFEGDKVSRVEFVR